MPKTIRPASDLSLMSSPTERSRPIPTPPATVSAPSPVPVLAVVAEILTTPPDDIEIASVSLAEPIVPASLIIMSSTNVTIPVEAIVTYSIVLTKPPPVLPAKIIPLVVEAVPL